VLLLLGIVMQQCWWYRTLIGTRPPTRRRMRFWSLSVGNQGIEIGFFAMDVGSVCRVSARCWWPSGSGMARRNLVWVAVGAQFAGLRRTIERARSFMSGAKAGGHVLC